MVVVFFIVGLVFNILTYCTVFSMYKYILYISDIITTGKEKI